MLQLPPGALPPQPGPESAAAYGSVRVTGFDTNRIDVIAHVDSAAGAWLVYADGYHRGWHATVNDQRAPIAKAYLAFKAVRLSAGRNVVRLMFWDGLTSTLTYALALCSVVVDLLLLAWLLKLVGDPPHGTSRMLRKSDNRS